MRNVIKVRGPTYLLPSVVCHQDLVVCLVYRDESCWGTQTGQGARHPAPNPVVILGSSLPHSTYPIHLQVPWAPLASSHRQSDSPSEPLHTLLAKAPLCLTWTFPPLLSLSHSQGSPQPTEQNDLLSLSFLKNLIEGKCTHTHRL